MVDKNRRMVEGSSPTIQSVQNTKHRIRLKCCTIQLYSESQQFFQEWNVGGRTVWLVGRPILSHNTLTYSESPFILDVTIVVTIHTSNLSRIPRVYPCKFFLAGVNFYRFNAKNWHFRQILSEKVAFFRCKFYSPNIFFV